MAENQPEEKVSNLGDRFRLIVKKNFTFNLIPPLIISISAIVVFTIAFRSEFDITLAGIAAVLAVIHGLAVFTAYQKNQNEKVFQAINFVACLIYLALLTFAFCIEPQAERGRGFAILIFGSALLYTNKYIYSAFGAICAVTMTTSFLLLDSGLLGRDLFYTCIVPLVLGFYVCHSRDTLLNHLSVVFDEKKHDQEQLKEALTEAQNELEQRVRFQEQLSLANKSFDRLIQVLPQVHWVRKNNEIIFISPTYESIWESTCEELYQNPNSFMEKLHPDDSGRLQQAFQKCFETGKFDEEYRLVMKDGRIKWIHARSYLDPKDSSTEFGVAEDISARKKVELENEQFLEKLSGKQRLESLGLLAGGIAHDFNNILMAVLINVDMLRLDIQRGHHPKIDRIEDIEKAALRASEICGQMLQFSGKEPTEVQILELSTQIQDSKRILDSSIPDGVQFTFDEPDEKKYIMGGSAQFQQVILNLISNAKEAVGESGKIEMRLSTERFNPYELNQAYIEIKEFAQDFHVITCKDDGMGMDKKMLERLFEPFYSSKDSSRGLGLATVIGIVKGHKGTILVDSIPGKGTEFKVLLPAHVVVSKRESESDSSQMGVA